MGEILDKPEDTKSAAFIYLCIGVNGKGKGRTGNPCPAFSTLLVVKG
jgi:hypothetical protein